MTARFSHFGVSCLTWLFLSYSMWSQTTWSPKKRIFGTIGTSFFRLDAPSVTQPTVSDTSQYMLCVQTVHYQQ